MSANCGRLNHKFVTVPKFEVEAGCDEEGEINLDSDREAVRPPVIANTCNDRSSNLVEAQNSNAYPILGSANGVTGN